MEKREGCPTCENWEKEHSKYITYLIFLYNEKNDTSDRSIKEGRIISKEKYINPN